MFRRTIYVSVRSVLSRPIHTLLVVQGIAWGAAIGVFPAAVVRGSLERVERRGEQYGADRVIVVQDATAKRRFDWSVSTGRCHSCSSGN